MAAHALDVLLISQDRPWLRYMAFLLGEFGYQTVACADLEMAEQAVESSRFDFVLIDETALDGRWEQIAALKQASDGRHVQVLLFSSQEGTDVLSAVEHGVDDFLHKPISAGELLARLRSGARFCEMERRMRQQRWEDPLTGLWSRQAFIDRLAAESDRTTKPRPLSVVMVDLDLFRRINKRFGENAGDRILRDVASLLAEHAAPGQFAARWDVDCFAVLVPNQSLDKCGKWAEKLREAIAQRQYTDLDPEVRVQASVGIAAGESGGADDVVERCRQALLVAKQSGRNCLVAAGQFEEERRLWSQQLASGKPFENCTAREVMTPLTILLRGSDTAAYAAAIFAQTHLDVLPVADIHDRFLGVLARTELAAKSKSPSSQPIEQLLTRDIPTIDDTASFETVIEQFIARDEPLLIVTRSGRPLGVIQRERFLNLMKPVEPDDLTAGVDFSAGSEYLVVPDAVEV